jgi:hypothetical protein
MTMSIALNGMKTAQPAASPEVRMGWNLAGAASRTKVEPAALARYLTYSCRGRAGHPGLRMGLPAAERRIAGGAER